MENIYEIFGKIIIIFAILWLLFKAFRLFWTCFLAHRLGKGVKWCPEMKNNKTWAVITGASDGIGKAYAIRMAQIGYKLLLISRSEDKLNATKAEIQSKTKNCPEIKILAIDLSRADIYDTLESTLQELGTIHVLINNVGISYTYPEYFTRIPETIQLFESIVNCNIICMTRLIHTVLPQMEANRSGVIINLSSYLATYPTPLLSMYSASKKFVEFFSISLQAEYADKGITVQCVAPAFVMTTMSQIKKTSIWVPTADVFVEHALRTVGVEGHTYGYWAHKLQGYCIKIVCNTLGDSVGIKYLFNMCSVMRGKYYKKNGLKDSFQY